MNRRAPVSLNDYVLGKPLGSGAMALVFDAIHKRTNTPVAIKLLEGMSRASQELRDRMAREAVVLASVESPNVSRLLDYGWEGEQPFLVLERLEGETLAMLLRRETRVTPARMIDWVEQLLVGLRDCHRANVIHRDIKPANIFLARMPGHVEPIVKLIDFGVARLNEIVSASADASLTGTHHLIGSVGYMAPEQLESAKGVSPAADLYAVGVVIFRSLSGRLPFVGESFDVLATLKTTATAPKLSSLPGMTPNAALDDFVARALSRDPEARFVSATEMLQDWWRVAAALDRDAVLSDVDVAFDEDQWTNTIVGSLLKGISSGTMQVVVRTVEMDAVPDSQVSLPSDGATQAAPKFEEEPPSR